MNTIVNASFYDLQPSFPLPVPARPLPALQRIGQGVELAGRLSPALASRLLWKLWFTPQSVHPNRRASALLASVDHRFEVYSGDEGVVVYSWGHGPAVLLTHGWSTYGAQLGSFVQPLVAAGHQVLLFDAPGHGGKPRHEYRLDQYAQLVHDIILHAGGVHAVIGHSLGATAAAMALHRLDLYARFIAIAPSANLKTVLQSFRHKLGVSETSLQQLRNALADFFGPDAWTQYSLDHHFPELLGPALLVHDRDDAEAPQQNSLYLQALRPDADTLFTQGLGHNRVLHDAAVVEAVTKFVTAPHILRHRH